MFLNSVTKVSLKVREGSDCGGTGLKLSLSSDGQEPCHTEIKDKFYAGELLEWKPKDLGNCSSANIYLLNFPKAAIIPSNNDTNFCPEYLTVRVDNDLFAASYEGGLQKFQFIQQQRSLSGNRSYIF